MINPTGGKIRRDAAGDGRYGASRGTRKHDGVDYLADQHQDVFSPITGRVSRIIQVYNDDTQWKGIEIIGKRATVQLFYVDARAGIVGEEVLAGDIIGFAQSISTKYNTPSLQHMKDHVHLRIASVDPECFVEV